MPQLVRYKTYETLKDGIRHVCEGLQAARLAFTNSVTFDGLRVGGFRNLGGNNFLGTTGNGCRWFFPGPSIEICHLRRVAGQLLEQFPGAPLRARSAPRGRVLCGKPETCHLLQPKLARRIRPKRPLATIPQRSAKNTRFALGVELWSRVPVPADDTGKSSSFAVPPDKAGQPAHAGIEPEFRCNYIRQATINPGSYF